MDDLELRRDLGPGFTKQHKTITYPYIFLPKYGEELAIIVTCLRHGNIPICLRNNGVLMEISSVDLSALELQKLLRVYKYQIVLSETDKRSIETITDIMEVLSWMVSS